MVTVYLISGSCLQLDNAIVDVVDTAGGPLLRVTAEKEYFIPFSNIKYWTMDNNSEEIVDG